MSKSARPTKHGENKWRIRWLDYAGERHSAIFDTHGEAEKELRHKQVERQDIIAGAKPKPSKPHTFKELTAYWREHKLPHLRVRKGYEAILKSQLLPIFGRLLITDITVQRIDAFVSARSHLKPRTIRNFLAVLRVMLRGAVILGWLPHAPIIQAPRIDPDEDERQPWLKTKDELRRLVEAARATPAPVVGIAYTTALYTGMRAGEVAGLRWSDVDFEQRTIHVHRSYSGKTKTLSSRRFVPITNALLGPLTDWREQCPKTEEDLVFPSKAGTMFQPTSRFFHEQLHEVLDRAGFTRPPKGSPYVHYIHFHSLRHTFACWWRLNGGSLDDLRQVLGHTSAAMTKHYANVGGYHRPDHFALFAAE